GVGLQSLDSESFRLFCPIGVDLDAIAMSGYAMKQVSERHAIPYAGIDCRELGCEGKTISQPSGFRHGQREKSQLDFSMWSHRATSECLPLGWCCGPESARVTGRPVVLKGETSKNL